MSASLIVRDYVAKRDAELSAAILSKDVIDEFASYFDKGEMEIKLLDVESSIVGSTNNRADVIQALFRDIHSLKGTSSMMNIDYMTHLLHSIEDVLGVISGVCTRISAVRRTDIFDFFLQAFDLIERLVSKYQENPGFMLKDNVEYFGFYVRVIIEARDILENIDLYFDLNELDESIF